MPRRFLFSFWGPALGTPEEVALFLVGTGILQIGNTTTRLMGEPAQGGRSLSGSGRASGTSA
jgi:hypothetical protein